MKNAKIIMYDEITTIEKSTIKFYQKSTKNALYLGKK